MATKEQLEAKRDGYDQELDWHRFLLDSYTGAGGYQGKVKQDAAGFWGLAAETYSTFASLLKSDASPLDTYLDRFPREDERKFKRRCDVAHYLNYVKPTTLIKVGYICRKPHKRNNVPAKLQEWIERSKYDAQARRRTILTAVLGWFPMLVDMPRVDEAAFTAAQEGKQDPYVVLSLPCHLLDYQLDDKGRLEWAKTATCYTHKATWDAEAVKITRYTMWTRDEWTYVEVRGESIGNPVTGKHPFRAVPLVPWRADVSVEDSIKAESVNASIALEARRLFNLVSELDEHIRAQVFALLIWPGTSPTKGEGGQAGTSDGLLVDPQAKHMPQFLAPPPTVAATLESRIANTVIEIYRIAGVEYERASGVRSSASSKENEFEKTNVGIAALAQAIAVADRETLILVGRALGCDELELQAMTCVAHESYADAALSDELEQVLEALTLAIGVTAKAEMLKRLVQKLLPGLDPSTRATIESEIDEAAKQAEKDAEALRDAEQEAAAEPENDAEDAPPASEESDGGDGEVAA